MATGLQYGSSPSLELVKTALDKIIGDENKTLAVVGKATAENALVFSQGTATNAAVISTVLGGGGYFEDDTDDVSDNYSVSMSSPTPKTSRISKFKKDLSISKDFMADQQLDAVNRAVRQQAFTWAASRDRFAFARYSGGFATYTTIDSAYLFSNSHTNQFGDTVDNLETGALSDSTLNASINSLRLQKNQDGVTFGYEPKFLLTPSLLHKTAMEVAKSVQRAGTGNNDLNYFSELYPGMQVFYSPFLDASSTTAYFVGSSNHGVRRFVREAFNTNLVDWKISENDSYKYKMRARETVDTIDYCGLVGSTGA